MKVSDFDEYSFFSDAEREVLSVWLIPLSYKNEIFCFVYWKTKFVSWVYFFGCSCVSLFYVQERFSLFSTFLPAHLIWSLSDPFFFAFHVNFNNIFSINRMHYTQSRLMFGVYVHAPWFFTISLHIFSLTFSHTRSRTHTSLQYIRHPPYEQKRLIF